MSPSLVLLGNLIVDDIVFADGRTRMGEPGGAMLYSALAAALWGTRVGVVAPVGTDYPASMLDALAARGVDLAGLRPLGRPGLRAWLLYEATARRVVHRLGSPSHADASPRPADIPDAFRSAAAFHLTPTPLACQAPLVGELAKVSAHLSLDPHDPITEASLPAWRSVLAGIDTLFVSEEEIDIEGLGDDAVRALRRLGGGRLRSVAIKGSSRGGLWCRVADGTAQAWLPRAEHVVDTTGAGDAFAGGYLSARLECLDDSAALRRGVVSASFAIEDWGAAGLLRATRDEATRRMRMWFEV